MWSDAPVRTDRMPPEPVQSISHLPPAISCRISIRYHLISQPVAQMLQPVGLRCTFRLHDVQSSDMKSFVATEQAVEDIQTLSLSCATWMDCSHSINLIWTAADSGTMFWQHIQTFNCPSLGYLDILFTPNSAGVVSTSTSTTSAVVLFFRHLTAAFLTSKWFINVRTMCARSGEEKWDR